MKIVIGLIFVALLFLSVQSRVSLFMQGNTTSSNECEAAYNSLGEFKTLASFGFANDPGTFKLMVEQSQLGQRLASCPQLADKAWSDVVKAGQDAQSKPATDHPDLRTALLVVVYGKNLNKENLEKLKAFVRTRPWNSGLVFSAHLAVDALLLHNNDPSRDGTYNTYVTSEMEAAVTKYAST